MGETVEIATESTMVACDVGTRWEVRCTHGVTPYLEIPGGFPQSPEQIRRRLMAQHKEHYGCNCTETSPDPRQH